jgi:dienelactone hydrolase
MQPLEACVLLLGLAFLAWLPLSSRRPAVPWLFLALPAVAFIALQVLFEGYRWHMLPAYAAVVLLPGCFGRVRLMRMAAGSLAAIGLGISAALTVIFPVFRLPAPTGKYAVGTVTLSWLDPSRLEAENGGASKPRELPVQVFYPAEFDPHGRKASYMPRAETTRLKPQLALIKIHAVENAPLARGSNNYPLIIYSPSWGGNRHEATYLVEDLASHGYVVACLDVPGETMVTVFPDGRILRSKNDPWLDFSSLEKLAETRKVVNRHLELRVADVSFALDKFTSLTRNHTSGKFYRRLDLSRVGLLGFSFGGSTAAQVCRVDARCKAGVDMDGFTFGLMSEDPIPRPFLFIETGDDPVNTVAAINSRSMTPYEAMCIHEMSQQYQTIAVDGGSVVLLKDFNHSNFSDIALYSVSRHYTGAGPVEPARAMSLVREYVRSFFDQQLRGIAAPLLDRRSPLFPEVTSVRSNWVQR